jgi:hypothetical protein
MTEAEQRVALARDSTDYGWVEELSFPRADAASVVIDASAIVQPGPLLLIRLAAVACDCAIRSVPCTVVPPNETVARYMSEMGLGAVLPDPPALDLPPPPDDPVDDALMPVTRIVSQRDADELDDQFERLFEERFIGPYGPLMQPFHQAFSELTDNATTHGTSEIGTLVSAQRYQGNRCVLVIGDGGIGIPEHLRRQHEFESDPEALELAIREGVSGTGEVHRGIGYHHIGQTIEQLEVPRAAVRIWSGEARLTMLFRHGASTYVEAEAAPRTRGTWIRVELRRS